MSSVTSPTTALVTVSQPQLPALPVDATLKKLVEVSAEAHRAVLVERTGVNAASTKFSRVAQRVSSEGAAAFVVIGGLVSAVASGAGLAYFGFPLLADLVAGVVAAGLPFGTTIAYEALNSASANRKMSAGTKRIDAIEAKATEARTAVLTQSTDALSDIAGVEEALRHFSQSSGSIDAVSAALAKLGEADQRAVATFVMNQVFTPEGAPKRDGVSVPDAAAFYIELTRLGAEVANPYVPAPAQPLDAPSERRFAQQMISFEALLATSLRGKTSFEAVLADLVPYGKRDKLPAVQAARGAELVFVMEETCTPRRTIGALREPIAKAAAIAVASWTSPLEHAGYSALAERFFDIIAAYGIHTGGYEKRLRDALENYESNPSVAEEAKRLLGRRA